MKIAIGTAQMGMPYGISNTTGQTSIEDAGEIIRVARERGIDTIDTAIAYGDSEQRLGDIGVNGFRIISKLPAVPAEITDIRGWVFQSVERSLSRLKQSVLHGLLLHRPEQLFTDLGPRLYEVLAELRDHGFVEKIGVSIYNPVQLESLIAGFSFDIVQSPINIFDRRIAESGWSKKLNDMGIELHGRSLFLQGLLLMPSHARPAHFGRWTDLWKCFDAWVARSGRTPLELALGFVSSNLYISRIVAGVENCSQLKEILRATEQDLNGVSFPKFEVEESLINPALWQ